MPRFTGLGRFFGNTVSTAGGFAAGIATAPTLAPGLQDIANTAWGVHQSMPLDAFGLAEGVAQGQVAYDWAQHEATNTGISKARFDVLVAIANTGPGVGEAYRMWRRGVIDPAGFRRAAQRAGLEQEWIDALVKLKNETLTPGELAGAIHRGLVPDPGLLKGEQPGPDRTVESYPVYPIPPLEEAAAHGYDRDHLGVLVGLQGLPMGPHEAAQAYFRGIITRDDYIAAFNESNNRNEWAEAILEQSRQIPTARDFFENALRGYHEFDWALQQAKRHGMSEADATVIYQNSGRPMNIHAITQALAWGAEFHPEPGELTDPYDASVVEGSVKPGYYEMAKALRYTLPSALYFRTLQANGVLSQPEAETWYLRLGWPPELAHQVSVAFANAKGAASKEATVADLLALFDGGHATRAETVAAIEAQGYPAAEANLKVDTLAARRVASARGTAVTDLHGLFKKGDITAAQATGALEALGISDVDAGRIVHMWDVAVNVAG